MEQTLSSDMQMAQYYHNGHVEHCKEQIKKVKDSFMVRWRLKRKYGISSEGYIRLMEKHIEMSDLEEIHDQEVTRMDRQILGHLTAMSDKVTKKEKADLEEMQDKRSKASEQRDIFKKVLDMVNNKLGKYGLSTSQIL